MKPSLLTGIITIDGKIVTGSGYPDFFLPMKKNGGGEKKEMRGRMPKTKPGITFCSLILFTDYIYSMIPPTVAASSLPLLICDVSIVLLL